MASEITAVLQSYLEPLQFEAHPFLVGWYNELVAPAYKLPYSDETLAFVIVSGPSSFERAVLPFYRRQYELAGSLPKRDIYDTFMRALFADIADLFPVELKPRLIHDFDMEPLTRRPLAVMQTAAHVAGAAFHYDFRKQLVAYRKDIDERLGGRRLLGVCLHPRYGGWFGLRGVAIFPAVDASDMERPVLRDLLATDAQKLWLCEEFNLRYAENRYRDISEPVERYSEQQQVFWKTPPAERPAVIERWIVAEIDKEEQDRLSSTSLKQPGALTPDEYTLHSGDNYNHAH